MELAKTKAEKEERERLERIEKELIEKKILEEILAKENLLRLEQLVISGNDIKKYDRVLFGFEDSKKIFEREVDVECRHIPDIAKLNDVNSFYVDWINLIGRGQGNLSVVFQHSPGILQLIEEMQEFLQLPPSTCSIQSLNEMGLIYHKFCETQQQFLDYGTYKIMIDLRGLFDPELGVFENSLSTKEIVHSLWGNLYSCPEYRGHFFEELNFRFGLPDSLVMVKGIYRLLKTEYDHFSHSSSTYYPPRVENFHRSSVKNWLQSKLEERRRDADMNLEEKSQEVEPSLESSQKVETIQDKWGAVKTGQAELPSAASLLAQEPANESKREIGDKEQGGGTVEINEDEVTEQEPVEINEPNQEKLATDLVADETNPDLSEEKTPIGKESRKEETSSGRKSTPTTANSSKKGKKTKGAPVLTYEERPKTEAELAKDRERKEKANFLPHLVHPNELNLRNFVILAGVYNFKFFEIPPQPKPRGKNRWTLHQIESKQLLQEINFVADYTPPSLLDLGTIKKTPEEMEREAKRQEEELQKLVLLEIKVPKIALWFDPPTPVRWIPETRIWSTDGFYDIRFREDSLQLSFRTVRFGIIGLAHNRWSNLPYQSWELRPNGNNSTIFILMAAMAVIEFTIKGELVCVSSLQNVGNADEVEKAILNKFMRLHQLVKALRSHGLDVFPDFDSYAYVDGVLVKHVQTEDHMYQCMAIGATAFNFHWSRWNLLAGREKMIYQIRERLGTSTPGNYQMILNTPKKTTLINCTEVSPTYSEEPMEDYEYCGDLLTIIKRMATGEAEEIMSTTNGHFVETLRILLSSIRPLSFS